MKVLIADKFPEDKQTELRKMGLEVVFDPSLSADDLPGVIADAQVLIVRSTRVTAAAIAAAKSLQLIIRAGAGTDTIDSRAAAAAAIAVANCPGTNSVAVAELTMGLVIALDRRIPDNVADIRRGVWNKAAYGKARGLKGRTIAVLGGAGRIGREVIVRARAFGMRVLAYDIALTDELAQELGAVRCPSIEEACSEADVICVHLPKTADTVHCLTKRHFDLMRPGTLLVNPSRGGVVDDAALHAAVAAGRIRAACDVYEEEPAATQGEFNSVWATLEGFYGTHHIGASTEQAQSAVADAALGIVRTWLTTGNVINCVNLARASRAVGQLVVRHLDRVGVLTAVLQVLKQAAMNVQEMQNTLFEGGVAATAKIGLERAPTAAELEAVRACPDVVGVDWVQ